MKYSIAEKQKIVNELKSTDHFDSDMTLFVQKFPRHRLSKELARANKYSIDRLSAQMIYLLIDVVSKEDILANRPTKESAEDIQDEDPNKDPNLTPGQNLEIIPVTDSEKENAENKDVVDAGTSSEVQSDPNIIPGQNLEIIPVTDSEKENAENKEVVDAGPTLEVQSDPNLTHGQNLEIIPENDSEKENAENKEVVDAGPTLEVQSDPNLTPGQNLEIIPENDSEKENADNKEVVDAGSSETLDKKKEPKGKSSPK